VNRFIKFFLSCGMKQSSGNYAGYHIDRFTNDKASIEISPWKFDGRGEIKIACDASLVDIDGDSLMIKLK